MTFFSDQAELGMRRSFMWRRADWYIGTNVLKESFEFIYWTEEGKDRGKAVSEMWNGHPRPMLWGKKYSFDDYSFLGNTGLNS
jgi:hypothetical protein